MSATSSSQDSARSSSRRSSGRRPDYVIKLGLLPPYSEDDVKQAYLRKVKEAHPDRGGTPEAFDELETAYRQALEHVEFRTDRRGWIAAHMDDYVAQQNVFVALAEHGATAEVEGVDWVKRSLGDFAALTEHISAVGASGCANVGEVVKLLTDTHTILTGLRSLDLSNTTATDELIFELRVLRSLADLNLRGTKITSKSLAIVHWLPALQRLDVSNTNVGIFSRFKARRFLDRRVRTAGAIDATVHPVNVR